jgi:hypothetical protein
VVPTFLSPQAVLLIFLAMYWIVFIWHTLNPKRLVLFADGLTKLERKLYKLDRADLEGYYELGDDEVQTTSMLSYVGSGCYCVICCGFVEDVPLHQRDKVRDDQVLKLPFLLCE